MERISSSSSHLLGIMQKIEKAMVEHGAQSEEADEMRKLAEKFAEDQPPPVSYRQAYVSACIRAFSAQRNRRRRQPVDVRQRLAKCRC